MASALGQLTRIFYPSNPGNPFVSMTYDTLGRPNVQNDAVGNATHLYFAGARTEIVDPVGTARVSYFDPFGRTVAAIDGLGSSAINAGHGNLTTTAYDGQGRVASVTYPAGNGTAYSYDAWSNPLTVTQNPVSGSGLSAIASSFTYTSSVPGQPNFEQVASATDYLGLVTTFNYDARGNRTTTIADTGGSGHFNARSQAGYDAQGRVLTVTDPLGVVTQNSYDPFGNLIQSVADSGHLNLATQLAYDAVGNVVRTTDPNGNVVTRNSDANRRLTSLTMPAAPQALTTAYTYDADGRVLQTTQSVAGTLLRTTAATYTLTGNTASATDANGNLTRYVYDGDDRLASVSDPLGRVTVYGYDALSRPRTASNAAIQANPLVTRAYSANGHLASLAVARSNSVADTTGFAYDGLDRLATTTWPDGSTVTQTYDADGNVLTRKTRKGDTISYVYDTLNRLVMKTPPSSPVVTYAYDLTGRLIGVGDTSSSIAAATTQASYATTMRYDAVNRPLNVGFSPVPAQTGATTSSVAFTQGYNGANQRIGQTTTDTSWLNVPTTASSTSYSANNLNQYTAIGTVAPTYDANGNLTYDGTFTYGYDVENRLVSASGVGNTVSYAYDAQGRRKSKTVNGTTTVYVTDAGNREVLEYSGSTGQTLSWYAYGLGLNEVLSQSNVGSNSRQTLIPDIQGSFIGTLDSGGTLTKRGYLPYGESASTTGSFAYTGQRIDPETNGLYYYRARMYSPVTGRFLQTDPAGYSGGANLYRYVSNDPLNRLDPLGLRPYTDGELTILRPIFGNTINYGDVDIKSGAGLNIVAATALAKGNPAITLGNTIYVSPLVYSTDYSQPTAAGAAMLPHETTHIYQYTNTLPGGTLGPLLIGAQTELMGGERNAYDISEVNVKTNFNNLGYEQQAQLVGSYVQAVLDNNTDKASLYSSIMSGANPSLGAGQFGPNATNQNGPPGK